jgi:hypothetical protein
MTKLTLNDINNISGNPTSAEQLLNANFTAIEEAIDKTLSRDGTLPNALEAALDANSQRIVNLPYALSNTEPVTLAQVMAIVTGGDWTGGAGIPAVVYYQEAQPTATAFGQVWVRTSDLVIFIWDGSGWVRQADPNLQLVEDIANGNTIDIADLKPRMIAVEADSANYSQAIIDLETDTTTLAGQITTISANLGTNTAAIVSESIARASGDSALSATINSIQASNANVWVQPGIPVPGVSGIPNPIPAGSYWYDSDDGNKPYRYVSGSWVVTQDASIVTLSAAVTSEQAARISGDASLATNINNVIAQRNADYATIVANDQARINGDTALSLQYSALTTSVGTLSTSVTNNNQARIDGDAALASQVSTTNSTVGGLSTTVSQHTSSINGIQGKYGVKIDANGYVTGFGLISSNNNASPTSTFTVLADNFRVVTPGSNPVSPFYVSGGVTYIRNVVIDSAAIGTATIGTVNLVGNSVTNVVQNLLNFQGTPVTGNLANQYSNLATAYGTANITVGGIVPGSTVYVRGYFNARGASSNIHWAFFRVRRDDGVILSGVPQMRMQADYQMIAWEWVDLTPVNASHTYTVQVMRSSNENIGNWQEISLIATNIKR